MLAQTTLRVIDVMAFLGYRCAGTHQLAVRIQGKSDRYQSHYEYVNEDEFIDLVCQFEDSDNWVTPGSDYATVTGNLLDGTNIEGQDTICIVPE